MSISSFAARLPLGTLLVLAVAGCEPLDFTPEDHVAVDHQDARKGASTVPGLPRVDDSGAVQKQSDVPQLNSHGCAVRRVASSISQASVGMDAEGHATYAYSRAGQWFVGSTRAGGTDEVVRELGGSITSIFVGASGALDLLVSGRTGIEVARRRSGAWSIETIGQGYSGRMTADDVGRQHVVFCDTSSPKSSSAPTCRASYATNASGTWVTTPIGSEFDQSTTFLMEVDAQRFVHLAYYRSSLERVFYSTNRTGVWTHEMLPARAGAVAAFALNGEGEPELVYSAWGTSSLVHVKRTPTGWQSSGSWKGSALAVSLKVGENGASHVVHGNENAVGDLATLLYGTNTTGTWKGQPLADLTHPTDDVTSWETYLAILPSGAKRVFAESTLRTRAAGTTDRFLDEVFCP